MAINLTIPEQTSGDVQQAFQQVLRVLQLMEIPELKNERSMRALKDGQSAVMRVGNELFTYTKRGGRLYKQAWDNVD